MNILIPDSWLREYLITEATPLQIQQYLSLCGPSVERIYEREGESVYDIEVTTNRVDSMSVMGIAREAAVILKQFGIKAQFSAKKLEVANTTQTQSGRELPLPKITNDPKLNNRTLCVVLSNVQRSSTPEWMAKRLRQIEINVHDVVIDITNYITHELGHPCHAFDYDSIMSLGGEIRVVEAKKGQKMTTLDGAEYATVGGEVVFENQKGEVIDLPSIKGTLNSAIQDSTKNVLLFIESIKAEKVRFASMTHAIRTVAAQLLEKNVDPELALPTLQLGVEFFKQLAKAQVSSKVYDEFPGQKVPQQLTVPLQKIYDYMGLELPTSKITSILEDLGCHVLAEKNEILVTPPTYRSELCIPAEVIEEVARIYGYHNLPSKIMNTPIPVIKPTGTSFVIENRLKRFLSAIGWQEVYTYSMVSSELAQQSEYSLDSHLKLLNPLTSDREYLRRSLVPSLIEILLANQGTGVSALCDVFEVANTYEPLENKLPLENLSLVLVSKRELPQVRSDLNALLNQLFIQNFSVVVDLEAKPGYSQSARLIAQNSKSSLGVIGIYRSGHVVVELSIGSLVSLSKTHPAYKPIPKTSMVLEDLTFTMPEKTNIGYLIDDLSQLSPLLSSVTFANSYAANASLSLIYHDPEQNIASDQVAKIRDEVIKRVEKKWQGKLVGKVPSLPNS